MCEAEVLLKGGWPKSARDSPESAFIINLLKTLPCGQKESDRSELLKDLEQQECRFRKTGGGSALLFEAFDRPHDNDEDYFALPQLESIHNSPQRADGALDGTNERDLKECHGLIDDAYVAFHGTWLESVNLLHHRFEAQRSHHERLWNEITQLQWENQQLENDNAHLRSMQAASPASLPSAWSSRANVTSPVVGLAAVFDPSLGFSPVEHDVQLPQLLTPSNDISVNGDEDEKAFEPQIDKAKLKTKLCKYFMQAGAKEQEGCPFFRRHGWCAFAHGEHELHMLAHSGMPPASQSAPRRLGGTTDTSLPSTPPLVCSPRVLEQSPAFIIGSPMSPLSPTIA
eukprot:gene16121-24696_t